MKKRAAVILGILLLTAAAISGCGKKYDKIELPVQSESQDASQTGSLRESGDGAAALSGSGGDQTGRTGQTGQEPGAEGDPTADASTLASELTMDSGFTDTDETVYILSDLVNLRTGCGTEYDVVTQLNQGDSLKRTGNSESWSRVLYKDKVCYVQSRFVSTEAGGGQLNENPAARARQPDGAAGTTPGSDPGADPAAASTVSNGRIVAVDAGHQAKGNSEKEPIGPGSTTMKAKAAPGTRGVTSKLPECELTLSIARKAKRILQERGYQVVMTRESNDVNLSNAERADLANKSGASVLVQIHGNSLDNSKIRGTLAMCQTGKNPYNGELHDKSYSLSRKITDGVCAATGFKNRGVQETDTMSGINWSTIPVSIVEVGFMSNPEEDSLMAQDEWQEKIAAGIADGIDAYFAD